MFGKKEDVRIDSEVFVIYDSKSQSYAGDLIQATNGPDLIRRIHNIFRVGRDLENNPHWMNAEDFSLFKIGCYDKKTGKLQVQNPEHVVNFHDIRAQVQSEQVSKSMRENPTGSTREQLDKLGIVPT